MQIWLVLHEVSRSFHVWHSNICLTRPPTGISSQKEERIGTGENFFLRKNACSGWDRTVMMVLITFWSGKQDLLITSTYPPFFFTLQDTRLFTGMVSKGLNRSWVNIGLDPSVYNIWVFSFWRNGWTRIAIFQETCSRNIRRHNRQGCWGDFFARLFCEETCFSVNMT